MAQQLKAPKEVGLAALAAAEKQAEILRASGGGRNVEVGDGKGTKVRKESLA